MGHPLNGGSHELHVSVYDPVRVHIGDLDGLPDLALQALGPSPGDRKLDSQGVPRVIWMLSGEVRSHTVGVLVSSDLRLVRADPGVGP